MRCWLISQSALLLSCAILRLELSKECRAFSLTLRLAANIIHMPLSWGLQLESDWEPNMKLFLFTSSLLLALAAGQETCQTPDGRTGVCVDWRYYVCHAGVETGLCSGDSNIRCCLDCDATCELNIIQTFVCDAGLSNNVLYAYRHFRRGWMVPEWWPLPGWWWRVQVELKLLWWVRLKHEFHYSIFIILLAGFIPLASVVVPLTESAAKRLVRTLFLGS